MVAPLPQFLLLAFRPCSYYFLPLLRLHPLSIASFTSLLLSSSSWLAHDNLVDPKDGKRGINGQTERRVLGREEVTAFGSDLLGPVASPIDINPDVGLSVGVSGLEGSEDVGGLLARVLSKGPRDKLQSLGEGADGVLFEPGAGVAVGLDSLGELDLGGPSSGEEAAVLAEGGNAVHSVVHGALQVVEDGASGGAEDDGGDGAALPGVGALGKHAELPDSKLPHITRLAVTHLVGSGGAETDKRAGVGGAADAAEVPLGGDFDAHHSVALDEVHGHLGDSPSRDEDLGAGIGDGLRRRGEE